MSIFAAPFPDNPLVNTDHSGGGQRCESVKLVVAIPASPSPIILTTNSTPLLLSTALNLNSFVCSFFTTLAACNNPLAEARQSPLLPYGLVHSSNYHRHLF